MSLQSREGVIAINPFKSIRTFSTEVARPAGDRLIFMFHVRLYLVPQIYNYLVKQKNGLAQSSLYSRRIK